MDVNKTISLLCLISILTITVSVNADSSDEGLLKRFHNPLKGYSIYKPDNAIDIKKKGSGLHAHWGEICPEKGDTLWSMKISHVPPFEERKEDIGTYRKSITELLKSRKGVDLESSDETTINGKPAILLSGTFGKQATAPAVDVKTDAGLQFWKAWVMVEPGEFLVIEFMGKLSGKDRWAELWKKTTGSIEWIDKKKALAEFNSNVERGKCFLWGVKEEDVTKVKPRLSVDRIRSALPLKPRWFLIRKDNKVIGWTCMKGGPSRKDDRAGYEIRTWSAHQIDKQKPAFSRSSAFLNSKFDYERWRNTTQVGSDKNAFVIDINGIRNRELIIRTITQNQSDRITRQTRIPTQLYSFYIPRLVEAIFPGMVDIEAQNSYTFADYSPNDNDFNMRTFKVDGKQTILLADGRRVEAVRLISRPTDNSPATIHWTDKTGSVVRTKNPSGFVVENTSRDNVLNKYADVEKLIGEINRIFDILILPAKTGKPPRRGTRTIR